MFYHTIVVLSIIIVFLSSSTIVSTFLVSGRSTLKANRNLIRLMPNRTHNFLFQGYFKYPPFDQVPNFILIGLLTFWHMRLRVFLLKNYRKEDIVCFSWRFEGVESLVKISGKGSLQGAWGHVGFQLNKHCFYQIQSQTTFLFFDFILFFYNARIQRSGWLRKVENGHFLRLEVALGLAGFLLGQGPCCEFLELVDGGCVEVHVHFFSFGRMYRFMG